MNTFIGYAVLRTTPIADLRTTPMFATVAEAATKKPSIVTMLIIALVIGLIVGLIYALALKGSLTSVYRHDSANDYTRKGSFKVDLNKDIFLYSKTEKTEKPVKTEEQPKQ